MKRTGILAAILLVGCAASTQNFEPTERVEGRTLEGDKVAIYPVTVGTGPVGEAKVWSSGAYKSEGDTSFVRIGLNVHNTSNAPIDLRADDMKLDLHVHDYGTVSDLRPMNAPPTTSVAPGQNDEKSLVFPLPPGVKPGDVEAMRLDWQLHVGGQTYSQRTPFIEEPEPVYPYEPYGPYGYMWPYGYGGWGYGYYGGIGYYGPIYSPHFHHGHDHFHDGHGGYGGHFHDGGNRTSVHPGKH